MPTTRSTPMSKPSPTRKRTTPRYTGSRKLIVEVLLLGWKLFFRMTQPTNVEQNISITPRMK